MLAKNIISDFFGAFSDGAILFPLILILSNQNGMNLSLLLFSSGLAYLVAGYIFKIPMSVQPLKSIAIAGLAIGASSMEIRVAAILLGAFFVCGLFFDLDSLGKKVPVRLIHGIQIGLGVLLIQQGLKYILPSGAAVVSLIAVVIFAMIYISDKYQYPVLGIFTSTIFFGSLFWIKKDAGVFVENLNFRPLLILSLVLPQIVLTSANSVLATINVSQKYFGEHANAVTARRLVSMIGFGNIFSGLIGGLPFCHGSGGLTAHVNGGAKTNLSNYIIGFTLLLAATAVFIFGGINIPFSPLLLSIPLITIGFMHAKLASSSWMKGKEIKAQLIAMAIAAAISEICFGCSV